MVASVFWGHPVDVCLSRKLLTGWKAGREKVMRRMKREEERGEGGRILTGGRYENGGRKGWQQVRDIL